MAEAAISPKQFILYGMKKCHERDPKRKGVHVVWTGLYKAYRKYYEDRGMKVPDPRVTVDELCTEGAIVKTLCDGGILIWFPQDAPKGETVVKDLMERMGVAGE